MHVHENKRIHAYLYLCRYYTIVVQLYILYYRIYENVRINSIQITVLTMTVLHLIKIPYCFKYIATIRITRDNIIINIIIRDFIIISCRILIYK